MVLYQMEFSFLFRERKEFKKEKGKTMKRKEKEER